jgi:predicted Zn-dependent protease
MNPERRQSRWPALVVILALNLLLVMASFLFINSVPAYAQDDKSDAQPDVGGVRFDVYPHPLSQGALAYTLADRWDTTNLTYYFHNCPSTLECDDGWEAVRQAFQSWAELSTLTFNEVDRPEQADIELLWSVNGPQIGYPGDVLAFATFPSDGGDVVFDDAEPWSVFDGSEFDLYLVAAHEIGHALGLDHSSDPDALMYPVLTRYTTGLSADDAAAIQALYGTPEDRPQQDIPEETGAEEVTGEISDAVPYELWEFEAFAGETLTITMIATSGDLTPYLGLLTDDEETVLAESGPASGGVAQIIYTFDADGTYVIMATREGVQEGFTSGSYTLSIEEGQQAVPPPDTAGTVLVTFQSYSPADLCEIYLSPSDEDEWGANLLDQPMTNGNYMDTVVPPNIYDVLAVGCDGSELEMYGIEVAEDLTIEIYEDEINVWVYEDQ